MKLQEITFWLSIATVIYVYAGYPLLLFVLSRFRERPIAKGDILPTVSIIIIARNEEANILDTLQSKVQQDYPSAKLEIIVGSDASTDATDSRVREFAFAHPEIPIKLVRQEEWLGKTSALNKAVAAASGEILVFADANSHFKLDAIRKLARNFNDSGVGYVTGRMAYLIRQGSTVSEGCGLFMRYENIIRKLETAVGSIIGSNGGIDAMRRSLYAPLRHDLINDFVIPLQVAGKGYRVVFEEEAVLQEEALKDSQKEFRMRVRVTGRAIHGLINQLYLLNIFRYGFLSLQIFSHKILRYLVAEFLLLALACNLFLVFENPAYIPLLGAHVIFYLSACLGSLKTIQQSGNKLFGIPYYFVVVNLAALLALIRYIKGERQVTWTPRLGK